MTVLARVHTTTLSGLRIGDAVIAAPEGDALFGTVVSYMATSLKSAPGKVIQRTEVTGTTLREFEDRVLHTSFVSSNKTPQPSVIKERDLLTSDAEHCYTVNRAERALQRIGSEKLRLHEINLEAAKRALQALYLGQTLEIWGRGVCEVHLNAIGVGIEGCAIGVHVREQAGQWIDLRNICFALVDEARSRPNKPRRLMIDRLRSVEEFNA